VVTKKMIGTQVSWPTMSLAIVPLALGWKK
jgi:hypothetical protein